MNVGKKSIQSEVLDAVDDRKSAVLRVAIAALALAIAYETRHLGAASGALFMMNVAYSALIYGLAHRREDFSKTATLLSVAADISIYSLMVLAGFGNPAIFIIFFSFPVLVAGARLGALYGLGSAAVSAGLFMTVLYRVTPAESFSWREAPVLPLCVLAVGTVLSYWAAAEFRFKERLALLKELSVTANPRLGVDRTAGLFLQRVLEFFDADTCVLAQLGPEGEKYAVREATRFRPQGGAQISPTLVGAEATTPLPRTGVAIFSDAGRMRRSGFYRILDPVRRIVSEQPAEAARPVTDWLKTQSFIAVPLRRHDVFRGYLCVGAFRTRAFRAEDALFLQQVADQIMPVLEHIRLVDHLASDAADEERRRIARSIHDRIIQPYLGLQIGLKSVHQMIRSEVRVGEADASQEKWRQTVAALESLITMTREGVAELRQYVYGLKQSGASRAVLVESLVRYASKFETATGIHVEVFDRIGQLDIQDRLAADIFQMAAEALSNVHRHTTANSVTLALETSEAGSVVLRVENEITAPDKLRAFRPGSISDRADALGGRTEVGVQDGRTVVRVEIPL